MSRLGLEKMGDRILPGDDPDFGYLVHCALTGLWGDHSPRPFFIQQDIDTTSHLAALGYFQVPISYLHNHQLHRLRDELIDWAKLYASTDSYSMVDWSSFEVKPYPTNWPVGRRLSFKTKVCPVEEFNGRDVDIFISRRSGEARSNSMSARGAIYGSWVSDVFARHGVTLHSSTLQRFNISTVYRRTHGGVRKGINFRIPDATITGDLEIVDPIGFLKLIQGGLGSHRGFGYGMVLIQGPA